MRAACAWLYVFIEIETSDIRHQPSDTCLAFVLRRKTAGSLEPGAWSASHRGRDVRRQTSDAFSAFVAHLAAVRYPWAINRA